jgi:hypothetical protein
MASRNPYHKEELRGDLLQADRAWIEANGHVGLARRTLAFWSAIYGFASMRRKSVIRPVAGAMTLSDLAEAIIDRAIVAALAA